MYGTQAARGFEAFRGLGCQRDRVIGWQVDGVNVRVERRSMWWLSYPRFYEQVPRSINTYEVYLTQHGGANMAVYSIIYKSAYVGETAS